MSTHSWVKVIDALFTEIGCGISRVAELDTKDAGSDKAAHSTY
jgi:hypothetical protein